MGHSSPQGSEAHPRIVSRVSAGTRLWLLGIAASLAAMAAYGLWRINREYPTHWAYLLLKAELPESPIDIQKALQGISDADGPRANAILPLAEFVQSNGRRIRVVLVQGQFFDQSIEPGNVWRNLGRDVLLVSSVNEQRSEMGSISSPISAGCAIQRDEGVIQELGSSSINRCDGVYGKAFHINYVARLSVIVEAVANSSKAPCWARYGIAAPEGDYQTCVSNAVSSSLSELFSQLHDLRSVDAIVLPAIGTGVGKLSKAGFYNKLLVDSLVPQLNQAHYIPSTIYLQVRRWDPDDRWQETQIAIAGAVATAVNVWNFKSEHKSPNSEWLSLTGVAIGTSLMLLALALGVRARILSDLLPLVTRPRPLIIISWMSAAVGLVSMFKAAIAFFPADFNPYLQVAAGLFTALLWGPLFRAGQVVNTVFESDAPGDSLLFKARDSSAEKPKEMTSDTL